MAHLERVREAREARGEQPARTPRTWNGAAQAVSSRDASTSLSIAGGRQLPPQVELAPPGERPPRASAMPPESARLRSMSQSQAPPTSEFTRQRHPHSDDEYDDDEDDVDHSGATNFGDDTKPWAASGQKDRRRRAHTCAEQKRRDSIKRGYDELQRLVPTCHILDTAAHQQRGHQQQEASAEFAEQSAAGSAALTGSGAKLSKAVVLQRSIDYIQHLVKQQRKHSLELDSLRKEVMALRIMKINYEEMVKGHCCYAPRNGSPSTLPDSIRLSVYTDVIDKLFSSFDSTVCASSFAELSACVFYWLEEYCKPRILRDIMTTALQQATDQHRCTGVSQPQVMSHQQQKQVVLQQPRVSEVRLGRHTTT